MSNPHLPAEMLKNIYATRKTRSKAVASFPNRGSRPLDNTFSPMSRFDPPRSCDHGKLPFRIPPPLPCVSPSLCLSESLRPSHPRMGNGVVGSWTFSRVVRFEMAVDHRRSLDSLSIFQGFSPVIRSLRIFSTAAPSSNFLNSID